MEMAFHGAAYCGWQKQPEEKTVQAEVEKALSTAFQVQTECAGAGRTDSGVHASHFVAHFDAEEIKDLDQMVFKLNQLLPHDISVSDVYQVDDEAHARFDAVSRAYEYFVTQKKDPFLLDRATYIKRPLSIELMNEAAQELMNFTNFKSFSKVKTQVYTFNCKVMSAYWEQKENVLIFKIKADRFLRNMVRAIVGTLIEVGLKMKSVEEFKQIIESRNRNKAGKSMPAHALFLSEINYPQHLKRQYG